MSASSRWKPCRYTGSIVSDELLLLLAASLWSPEPLFKSRWNVHLAAHCSILQRVLSDGYTHPLPVLADRAIWLGEMSGSLWRAFLKASIKCLSERVHSGLPCTVLATSENLLQYCGKHLVGLMSSQLVVVARRVHVWQSHSSNTPGSHVDRRGG